MKVLVATRETQGFDGGDYSHTVEGELVVANVAECDAAGCGCDRGFPGLASHRATTTALVVDLDISPADLREAIRGSLDDQGWLQWLDEHQSDELVDEHVSTVEYICRHYAVGTVLRRRGTRIWCEPLAA